MEIYRRSYLGLHGDSGNGKFIIPHKRMTIVCSNGGGWDHVSVSVADRCPSWDEMEWVKREFFEDGDCCMQLHVPPGQHINVHPYCLHIWRPHEATIPRPPAFMVA